MLSKRLLRRLMNTGLVLFGLANVVVFFHAWQLTHFSTAAGPAPSRPKNYRPPPS
ncbi:hypothetical protein [Hymenobacter coccineus]|uniref:hypothetical protein n=1 Tax=Hymenobacter coccineus TaxID=1908235 RepID=UPI001301857B|nr:hypothetical protein [Hymenobacter coccineus]